MGSVNLSLPERSTQHPTIKLALSEADLRFEPTKCKLYVLLQLPPALFLDPFQVATTTSTISSSHESRLHGRSPGIVARVAYVDIFGQQDEGNSPRYPIELEKAVGWTDPDGTERQKIQTRAFRGSKKRRKQKDSSSEGLNKEFTLNLLQLELDVPDRFSKGSSERFHSFDFPLHARYLPPFPGLSSSPNGFQSLWASAHRGNYERVQFPPPQLMYSCLDDGGPELVKDEWEYSVTSAVLSSEWAPLSPALKDLSNKERDLFVFAPAGGSTRPWSVTLPKGDRAWYVPIQLATIFGILLASVYIIYTVLRVCVRAGRKESQLTRAYFSASKTQ